MIAFGINTILFLFGLLVLVFTSGSVYKKFVLPYLNTSWSSQLNAIEIKLHSNIGKFENVLCFILAWNGHFETIGLFFIGKILMITSSRESLEVRSAGTIINFIYSVIISLIFKDISKFIGLYDSYLNPAIK